MYSLLRKAPWKWSFVNRWKRGVWSKLIILFTLNFPFICYLIRICKNRVMNLKYYIHTYIQRRNFYQSCCGTVFISTKHLCLIRPEPKFLTRNLSVKSKTKCLIEVFSYIIWSLDFKNILRMYSLFIAFESDEWCRFVVHIAIGFPSIISFYCVCFFSFYSFCFFLSFFVSSITCWCVEA